VACAVQSNICDKSKECTSRHTWVELYRAIADCVDSISLAEMAKSFETMENLEYAI
jgi:DNA-binding IscR family transcriptional regulator